MSIQPTSHASFSDSTAVVDSRLADKAYRQIGIFYRIIDFFRGGVEYANIQRLLTEIMNASDESIALSRFEELRELAKFENQSKFKLSLQLNREDTYKCTFFIKDDELISLDLTKAFVQHEFAKQDSFLQLCFKNYAEEALPTVFSEDLALLKSFSKAARKLGGAADFSMSLLLELMNLNQQAEAKTSATNMAKKCMLLAEAFPQLHCQIKVSGKDHYEFKIGNEVDYSGQEKVFTAKLDSTDSVGFVHLWATTIRMDALFQLSFFEHSGGLSLDSLIEGNIQCMADDEKGREFIRSILNDPFYCSANFVEVKPHPQSNKMIAVFKGRDGNSNQELVFSNRESSKRELRGAILKHHLADTEYNSLYDIVSRGYKTEEDSFFIYVLTPTRLNLILNEVDRMAPEDAKAILKELAPLPIGNTTFGRAWPLPVDEDTVKIPNNLLDLRV